MVSHPENFRNAKHLENSGQFEDASEQYILSAFARLAETGFIRSSAIESRITDRNFALVDILRAEYCAVEAGHDQFAVFSQEFLTNIVSLLEADSELSVVIGWMNELVGDSYLPIEPPLAIKKYEQASLIFDEIECEEKRSWGMEPEFEQAYWAFEDLVHTIGGSVPDTDTPLTIDFDRRIQTKIRVAKSLVERG